MAKSTRDVLAGLEGKDGILDDREVTPAKPKDKVTPLNLGKKRESTEGAPLTPKSPRPGDDLKSPHSRRSSSPRLEKVKAEQDLKAYFNEGRTPPRRGSSGSWKVKVSDAATAAVEQVQETSKVIVAKVDELIVTAGDAIVDAAIDTAAKPAARF